MRKLMVLSYLLISAVILHAQEVKSSLKKGKLYVNDTAVCILDKIKKGFLAKPNFSIQTLDEKEIGSVVNHEIAAPLTGNKEWFTFKFAGFEDSILLSRSDLEKFNSGLLVDYSQCIGRIIARNGLIKNNAVDAESYKLFKENNNINYATEFAATVEKEKSCISHKNDPAISNASFPVKVVFLKTDTVSKNTAVMHYDIMQNDVKIASITARGALKVVKNEDEEYDYSPGTFNLDLKGGPMNYEFTKVDGCLLANYNGEERYLSTLKDGAQTKSVDLKKFNSEGVKSRIAYMQAMVNFLVQKRYL